MDAGGGNPQHSAGVTFLGVGRLSFSGAIHGSALRLSAHLDAWKVIDPVRLLLVALPACRHTARVGALPARPALYSAHAPSPLLITKAGSTPTFAPEALCAVASFALVSLGGGIPRSSCHQYIPRSTPSLSDCSKWRDGAE